MNDDRKESSEKQSTLSSEKNDEQVAENITEKDESEKQSIYDAIAEQEGLEEAVAKNNSGKWSVGPSLAPVYFNGAGDGSPVGADFTANSKTGNLNLSYGVNVAYEVGKKVKIRSGVHRVNSRVSRKSATHPAESGGEGDLARILCHTHLKSCGAMVG